MVNRTKIEELVNAYIEDKDIFLVKVKVSTANRISILVDRKEGITIDECVALSRYIESQLDRETEDFELLVSSPGLGEPLLVREQYDKNVGRKVELTLKEGKPISGILKGLDGNLLEIETKHKEKGKKKEVQNSTFRLDEIRSVKVIVTFK